ncbi:MAG: hypothetical protein J1F01_02480 [Oscillospiraceae bacterium]|nr:hypothetical protein [Oscillospiraceae bacterium]
MNEVIMPAILSGASSAFIECATNAIIGFFSKKNSVKRKETTRIEIRRYVDDYLNKQYPNLVDYRYINDRLYEFMIDFIKYTQPQINVNGNVTINLIIVDNGVEGLVSNFLNLPENQKWNEIELCTKKESEHIPTLVTPDETINSLRLRANKVGLQLDISDDCTAEKIEELYRIVEKYESLNKKRR